MKKNDTVRQVPAGNLYDKYGTKNPIARYLTQRFLHSVKTIILKYKKDIHSIVEVGCGEGHLAAEIASLNVAPVKACDLSVEIITLAKKIHVTKNISFYAKDIFDIGAEEKSDLVICCEVLEHLSDPSLGLQRLSAVCKKYCLLSVPNEPLWRILNIFSARYLNDLGNTPGHLNHWSVQGFCRFVSNYVEIIEAKKSFPWTVVFGRCKRA